MTLEWYIVGSYDENPKLKSIVHNVEVSNFQVKEHSVNVITETNLIRLDSEVFSLMLLDSIVDWRKDENAIDAIDKYFVTFNGQMTLRNTTL